MLSPTTLQTQYRIQSLSPFIGASAKFDLCSLSPPFLTYSVFLNWTSIFFTYNTAVFAVTFSFLNDTDR